jgi:hypothetical protein
MLAGLPLIGSLMPRPRPDIIEGIELRLGTTPGNMAWIRLDIEPGLTIEANQLCCIDFDLMEIQAMDDRGDIVCSRPFILPPEYIDLMDHAGQER